jgi:hypothetical protein
MRSYCVVRDVSWHPYLPVLMSTSWGDGGGWGGGSGGGSVAMHEWKGRGKLAETVEDAAERERLEALR